jgi:hypothetical protein
MPSIMFDSENLTALLDPRLAGCRVATYADLVTPELVRKLQGRLKVIDRGWGDELGLATIADVEPGLLTVAEGAAKLQQWHSENRPRPTGYCDRATWPEFRAAAAPLKPWWWIATLDGTGNPLGEFPAAVQLLGEAAVGLPLDLTVVWDDHWFPLTAGLPGTFAADLRHLAALLASDADQLRHLAAQV